MNRLLTLVGRAADCKIHLTADDISPYHCGLVSTPTGLWVVDLSGRGVVVNGERMRVAPLPHGAELWVGRFLIGCQYQVPPPPSGASGLLSPSRPAGGGGAAGAVPTGEARVTTTPAPVAPVAAEDEVELGAILDGGLPGSHIMADAFRLWTPAASGALSNPILVSGSGPKPPAALPGGSPADDSSHLGASDDWSVAPLLRQLAEHHGRAGAEFQQTLALVDLAFGRAKREHVPVLQHELARIFELTAEIVALQLEVARRAVETAADRARADSAPDAPRPADPRPGGWVPPSSKTPIPDTPTPPPRPDPSAQAARAADRLAELLQARAARWYSLAATFAGT